MPKLFSAIEISGRPESLRTRGAGVLRLLIVLAAAFTAAACGLWMSPDEQVVRAREHLENGRYRSAMAEAKTVLEDDPGHAQARLLLAEVSLWIGDLDAAEGELKRALDVGLPPQDATELRYKLLLARGKYDEMLAGLPSEHGMAPAKVLLFEARAHEGRNDPQSERRALQQALELSPDDPEVLLQTASLDATTGQISHALELTARIAQPPIMHARAQHLRGLIFRSRGEYAKSLEALIGAYDVGRKSLPVPEQLTVLIALAEAHLALRDAEAAGKVVDQLAVSAPDSVPTHYLRARVALLRNDPVTAVTECQRALRVAPQHTPSNMLLAVAHLSHGSFEQAEAVLQHVLSADPGNLAATKLLAQVYLGRGEPQQAQRVLSSIAQDSQSDAQVDWLKGAALLQSGNVAGLSALEKGQAAAPADLKKRVQLASAYIVAGFPDKAIQLLRAVPSDSPLSVRAQALMVVASVSGKTPAEASVEIDRLVAADSRNVDLLTAAGAQLARSGETQKAQSLLERVVQLDPKTVRARWSLAQLAARSQDLQRAEKILREILTIDPTHQQAHMGLAELAWHKGDREQARKWLEDAVRADPATIEARLRLAQLAFVAGDAPRGKDLLETALRISPATERGSALNATGQVLASAGFIDDALARYKEAGAAGAPQGMLNAAQLYQESGRSGDARQLLEAALADRPGWAEAARRLVELDARDGQVDRALARVRSIPQITPAASLEYQGDAYVWAKQYPAALAAYEEAHRKQASAALAVKMFNVRRAVGTTSAERSLVEWLRTSPEDVGVRRVLAGYYEAAERPAEAIGEYEKLLAAERIDAVSLNNLAWLLHAKRDARALTLARRAYLAAPQIPAIADTYGWILVQTDKVGEGLVVLERALAGASNNPDIRYHVAAAYLKSGRSDRGAELLRELLHTQDKFASRREAEQLMQSLTTATPAAIPQM